MGDMEKKNIDDLLKIIEQFGKDKFSLLLEAEKNMNNFKPKNKNEAELKVYLQSVLPEIKNVKITENIDISYLNNLKDNILNKLNNANSNNNSK